MTDTKRAQRGYINIPSGLIETLVALAAVGLLALLAALGYGLWWLWAHVQFVA